MKKNVGSKKSYREHSRLRSWIFPACVIALYLILLVMTPERAIFALRSAGRILTQAIIPLLLAFGMMFLLNIFLTPAHVSKFMGRRAGIKGILLSSSAGIVSMGPIFAWYPLLKTLREKGAADFHLANFLSSRAVKPVMLPLMISFFGWRFSLTFTGVGIVSALIAAAVVSLTGRRG